MATQAADLARNGATTFAALNRSPQALADTITETPPTLAVGTRALRRSRPVVAQTTILFSKLRPVTRELPDTLPPVSDALRVGTPVLRRSVGLSGRLRTTSLAAARPGPRPQHPALAGQPAHRGGAAQAHAQLRGAVPDGLQLRQLLLPPAGRAPVPARAGRQHPAAADPHGQPRPAQQPRHDLQLAAVGPPAGPVGTRRHVRRPARRAPDGAAVPAGDRRRRQRRLPERPGRLPGVPPDRGLRAQERRRAARATPTTS